MDMQPVAVSETFTAIIEVYDDTGTKVTDAVMVYLAVIGGNQLFGFLLGETSDGDALFENLSFMAYGFYQLIATSSNIFSEPSSYIHITDTLTEKYLKITVADSVRNIQLGLGQSFSITVQIYLGTTLYTSGSYNVILDLAPSTEDFEGSLTGTSSLGLVTFSSLSINAEGLYAFFGLAEGAKSEFSQTFSVKTKDYIKITLSDTVNAIQDLESGELFTITLEVFVDSAFTLSEYDTTIIDLLIFQDTTIYTSLSGSTTNGILVFIDLSLSTTGDFTILATSDTAFDASVSIATQGLCAYLFFTNNFIVNSIQPDTIFSVFSVTVMIYTSCSYNDLYTTALTVVLSLDPEGEIIGDLSGVTLEGQVIFDDLMINNEGVYKIQASSEGVQKDSSLEFMIYEIYLKVTLIGLEVRSIQPKYAIDIFTIKVEAFVGVDFIRVFNEKDFEVSLSLEPVYEIKGQTVMTTSLGVATFNDLLLMKLVRMKSMLQLME